MTAACAPRASGPEIGTSDRPSGGIPSRKPDDAGVRDAAAVLPADYRTTFTKLTKSRFVSQGHAFGRWDVDVYANELAQKALASKSKDVPVGAIVVQEHFEKAGGSTGAGNPAPGTAPGPVMLMEKKAKGFSPDHGDWRYAIIGSNGLLVKDGTIDSCAGCHDDAPADGLFSLPP